MILGIGHDIVYLPRFVSLLRSRSSRRVRRLAERVLHPIHEKPQFDAAFTAANTNTTTTTTNTTNTTNTINTVDTNSSELVRAAHLLANAWACKEALYKALDTVDQPDCRFNAWYKHKPNRGHHNGSGGKPAIACDTYTAAHPTETFWLSISHDGDYLSAYVIREGK